MFGVLDGGKPARGPLFRTVIIGAPYELPLALKHPAVATGCRINIVGVVPLVDSSTRLSSDTIRANVRAQGANTILIAGTVSRARMDSIRELAITLGCRLLALMTTSLPTLNDLVVIWEGEHPLFQMAIVVDSQVRSTVKRALDIVVSAVGLVLASPIIIVAFVAIRLESHGAPLFGHERIGRGGRRFRCWKMRTMTADAEQRLQEDAELLNAYQRNDFKLPDASDPRVTRVGRFLRQTSIDEIPQLWNVLVGDMSLVGPRPLVADELQHYEGEVLTLLSVRPGLTGAWAVSGRHNLTYPARAAVELDYVRSHSLGRDLRILFQTASAVLDPGAAPRK